MTTTKPLDTASQSPAATTTHGVATICGCDPLLDRARARDADHVVVLAQGSEAGEYAGGKARERFNADAANAAAERNSANQPQFLPALEIFRIRSPGRTVRSL